MDARRGIFLASLVVAAAILATFIFLTALSAQQPSGAAPPGPGAPGGPPGAGGTPSPGAQSVPGAAPGAPPMPGMPTAGMPGAPPMMGGPGMGGGGGGGALDWTSTEPDPLLQMTYDEFLVKEGAKRCPIPHDFLFDATGQAKKRSAVMWKQLAEVYPVAGAGVTKKAAAMGRTGASLLRRVQTQLAVIEKEHAAVRKAYDAARGGFWFEVGYPQYDPAAVTADGVSVRVEVIMHVKPSLQKSYGQSIYKLLKPYDNYGEDRAPFTFVTYQGGYWHPHTLSLHPSTIDQWNGLWGGCTVKLELLDAAGQLIAGTPDTPAGLNGNAPALIAYPPEIRRSPAFAYLLPTEDRTFTGDRRLNLDYAKGWRYTFTFQLDLAELARLDRARAALKMVEPGATPPAASTGMPGMGPGSMPGMPPGAPPMPGSMGMTVPPPPQVSGSLPAAPIM